MRFLILMIAGGSAMICVLTFSQQTRRTDAMADDQRLALVGLLGNLRREVECFQPLRSWGIHS